METGLQTIADNWNRIERSLQLNAAPLSMRGLTRYVYYAGVAYAIVTLLKTVTADTGITSSIDTAVLTDMYQEIEAYLMNATGGDVLTNWRH